MRKRILIVDDSITNLKVAKNCISEEYEAVTAPNAAKMFDYLEKHIVSLIMLDVDMPVMNGYEAIKILKKNPKTKDIPVIFLTAKADSYSELEGLGLGAVDYVFKPFIPMLLLRRINIHMEIAAQKEKLENQLLTIEEQQLKLARYSHNLEHEVAQKTRKVVRLQEAVIKTMSNLVEARDGETGGHVERTMNYLMILTERIIEKGLFADQTSQWDFNIFYQSSQLHDVGKIAISDTILLKPGKLTQNEFDLIKQHTMFGEEIIDKICRDSEENDFLKYARLFASAHQEKWDGSGYPRGLKGEDIPLPGRLMAIADVYDALVSRRPYKEPFTHDRAVQIIAEGKGTHFDPVLVDVFLEVESAFAKTAEELKDL